MSLGPLVEAVCCQHTTYRQKTKEKKAKEGKSLRTFVRSRTGMSGWWYIYLLSQPPNYTVARKMHGGEGLRGRRSTKVWSCPAGSSTQVWSSAPRNVQVVWFSMKTPPPEEKIVFFDFFLKSFDLIFFKFRFFFENPTNKKTFKKIRSKLFKFFFFEGPPFRCFLWLASRSEIFLARGCCFPPEISSTRVSPNGTSSSYIRTKAWCWGAEIGLLGSV